MKKFLLFCFVLIALATNAQAPQMSFPKQGLDTLPVKFSYWWQHVAGGVAYRIECDTTAQFNSPLKRKLSATDASLQSYNPGSSVYLVDSNYHYNEQYFWRIRTIFTNDSSAWSPAESYKTRDKIGVFSPTDLSYATPSSFFVAHIAGTTHYELQISTDPIFTNPIYYKYTTVDNYSNYLDKKSVVIPGTGYSQNTSYNWRIRAFNAVDSTAWSKTYTFTTLDISNDIVELNASELIYPNPTSDKLYINNSKNCTLMICDIQGRVIEKVIADPKHILDVSNYSNGMYILQIFEGSNAIGVKKFSVIR
jgi:hypothetical protein